MAKTGLSNSNIKSSNRIDKLREAMLNRPEICIERGHLMTESYKQTEDKPPLLRRAMALDKILREMTVRIEEGELLVGAATGKRIAGPLLPEVQWQWYIDELDTLSTRPTDSFQPLTLEEKSRTREMLAYWKGKSVFDKWISIVPQEYQKHKFVTWATGGANPWVGIHLAHCCPGYERVLTEGLSGIKKQIEFILPTLDPANIEDFNKSIFYKAIIIILDAVMAYADRYAQMAEQMANAQTDGVRKAELEEIARICRRVPENPASSFYEALQSLWFAYITVMLEGWGPGLAFGRMDQYLYPFYKKDLATGKITEEAAREFIALFYIKLNELIMPFSSGPNADGTGQIPLSVITLGGITREGNNAVNELSFLFLEAEERVRLLEDIAVRIHTSTPESFIIKACQIAKLVRGKIKFVSDETITQQLLNDGKPIGYARDYGIAGCFIRTIPGRSHDPGGDFLNLPIMLELALNNGKSRITGEQIGPKTGDARDFKTYEDLWNAYIQQVQVLVRDSIIQTNIYRQLFAELLPTPFQSALYDSCLKSGLDITNGGANPYSTLGFWVCGIPNVGDSLAVIKKLVFEEKRFSLSQLNDALEHNFGGYDEMLNLIKQMPKFGNDNDYVDAIVNEVLVHCRGELCKYTGFAGFKYTLAAGAIVMNIPLGKATGALPDGRKVGEPLSEGGISPYQGRNISGPTATLRSVAKLDLVKASGGAVLNMRFNPDGLNDDSKMRKFAHLIKSFCETGGDLIQFNIVSSDTLREAQKHPEKYRDLLVRVATYSAYFVEIPAEMQNDIIARTEFNEL